MQDSANVTSSTKTNTMKSKLTEYPNHAEDLERENERLRTALEVINTWASSDTSFNDVMEDICEHSKEVLFPH